MTWIRSSKKNRTLIPFCVKAIKPSPYIWRTYGGPEISQMAAGCSLLILNPLEGKVQEFSVVGNDRNVKAQTLKVDGSEPIAGAHTLKHMFDSQHVERLLHDAPVEQRQVQHRSHPSCFLLCEEITGGNYSTFFQQFHQL